MTHLSPMDILVIQNAIEEYSRKYPGRPTPSAEEALTWKFGDRGRRKKERQAKVTEERTPVRLFEILRGWWMPHRRA
ncbi:MAG: hypothetical protein WCD57_22735 [Acidobacteriaceae bacterium]